MATTVVHRSPLVRRLLCSSSSALRQSFTRTNAGFVKLDAKKDVIFRPAEPRDLKAITAMFSDNTSWAWARDGEMLQTLCDIQQGGVQCLVWESTGQIVGVGASYALNEAIGIGSFKHVDDKFRGTGIGRVMQRFMIKQVGHLNIIGFFKPEDLSRERIFGNIIYWSHNFQGAINPDRLHDKFPVHDHFAIAEMTAADFVEVGDYDSAVFGYCRRIILKALFAASEAVTLIAKGNSGKIVGIIHAHPVTADHATFFQIFPWIADDDAIAHALFQQACIRVYKNNNPQSIVAMSSPVTNPLVRHLVQIHKLKQGAEPELEAFASTKAPPSVCLKKVFACSFDGLF